MKKKVIKYIFIGLLFAGIITFLVFYITKTNYTRTFINNVWAFLNKPLPIVGVTTIAVLFFIWKVVVATNYGKKKLQELNEEKEKIIKEKNDFINKANGELQKCYNKISDLRHELANACNLSTNQKIKALGKEIEYGKESSNNNSKEE
ncbi:MAG: hypothetical protein IKA31_04750 [Clostridia bacterium]|nr:hypothetical protein [Clostridia bacterium]MBR3890129.1 hypothetical protein [bacterium]